MSTALDEIIDEYNKVIASITPNIAYIDSQIASLNVTRAAMVDEIIDVTVADINTILEAKGDYVYTWGDYGTKNVTEFRVYDLTFDGNVTYISDTSFKVSGDQTAIFLEPVLSVPQTYIRAYCGAADGYVYNTVKSATYSSLNVNTTVVIEDTPEITANIEDVYTDVYNYGDDTAIDSLKVDFDFAVDYIYSDYTDVNGYGIDKNITNYNLSKTYLNTNKTNYQTGIDILERYST